MHRAVCFGELMLRLSPPGYQKLQQTKSFDVLFGGGEANVAVSLCNYGIDASYVTKLPNNPMGEAATGALRWFGVDTGDILYSGDRIGIYYCEKGASMRPSRVVYDRKNSAIACAQTGEFDWKKIFKGAEWFHWTGITPALGDNVAAVTLEAVKAAKEAGVTVSCDLNYRKNLWSRDKAGKTMAELMPYVDVLIANEEDAADVFGIHAEGTDIESGVVSREGYLSVCKQLVDRFGFKRVAITMRESHSASDNGWSGLLYDGKTGEAVYSRKYDIHLVDRVGGGDSFGGGLIYSLLNGADEQKAIDFAVAASALKQTIEGDFNMSSIKEVEALMGGSVSGRVQR